MNYIELFAGCGGLSLGLKAVGFKLKLANELSPMAAESFAFNFFKEDLEFQANKSNPKINNSLWLSSQYSLKNLKKRLRENPKDFPKNGDGYSDLAEDGSNINENLIIGSIIELNNWLSKKPIVLNQLKNGFGDGEIDLISGGPPCQSFSMAGLREKDSEKNTLPWEFVKFVKNISPKIVLLENVTGILRPFKDKEGSSFYAWFEIAKAFAQIGYIPLCLHVNAKYAGVPQNRPRFILLGVREDFSKKISSTFNESEKELFKQPTKFFNEIKLNNIVNLNDLAYRDIARPNDFNLFNTSFLSPLVINQKKYVTVKDAIGDLRKNGDEITKFSIDLNNTFHKILSKRNIKNHDFRKNNPLVRRRFRIYQIISNVENETKTAVLQVLKGDSLDLEDENWNELKNYEYLTESGLFERFKNKKDFVSFLNRHPTKKQTQKALIANQPAPAALSIPDDACHYHHNEQRTLTVREMARIQSFPDNFEFRSKITTGGGMRSFEVPQYTQVGNAVPPLLGYALGLVIHDLISRK